MEYKKFVYGDDIGYVEYIDHMGDDLKAVNAARNSYGRYSGNLNEKDKKLLEFLIDEGHLGVLEHNSVTFKFKVPMFVARQHHRHRTFSYNEISRRYTSFDIEFFVPNTLRIQDTVNKQNSIESDAKNEFIEHIKEFNQKSLDLYNNLIENGICREQARGVLTNNLYTTYWGTANLRNILHFLDLRLDKHAQLEIKVVAMAMEEICEKLFPNIMNTWRKYYHGQE